ncbi:hypothetical protein C7S14_4615 [Burkholderia cepacia]|nr:hypothetical protein C7S14_4615 [Burkholderia cepacia]
MKKTGLTMNSSGRFSFGARVGANNAVNSRHQAACFIVPGA